MRVSARVDIYMQNTHHWRGEGAASGVPNAREVESIVMKALQAADAIIESRDYTPLGASARLATLASTARASVRAKIGALLKGLDANMAAQRAALQAAERRAPADPARDLLKHEIRVQCFGLDALDCEVLYRAGDPLVMEALESGRRLDRAGSAGQSGSVFRPFVSAALVAELADERLVAADPAKAEELAGLRDLYDFYESVEVAALADLNEISPEPESIPQAAS